MTGNLKFSNLPPKGKINSYPSVTLQSLKLYIMAEMLKKYGDWNKELTEAHKDEMIGILEKDLKQS